MISRLCLTGFTFAQPFLASALIEYLEERELTSTNHGYGLIGASVLVYVGIAVGAVPHTGMARMLTTIRSPMAGIDICPIKQLPRSGVG